jgi:hypothetical protein
MGKYNDIHDVMQFQMLNLRTSVNLRYTLLGKCFTLRIKKRNIESEREIQGLHFCENGVGTGHKK